jgi:transcriptional regulator GlxA family with amidase domain
MAKNRPRTIVVVALPGVQLLDVSGPLDVFAQANAQLPSPAYRLLVVGRGRGLIQSSSGIRLVADLSMEEARGEKIDTLLVAGCPTAPDMAPEALTVAWLRDIAPTTRRYGSVCTGAFFLAAAGLLNKRRVTTHWAAAERLAAAYPQVIVDADAIHTRDGRLRTAAGVTAGLDLALALVEEDHGHEVALRIAGQLVMYFRRPGGQLQFSRGGTAAISGRSALQEVQRWIVAHPGVDHSVPQLAERCGLSTRHFARLFRHEVGVTPAAWIESVRVHAARQSLEAGHAPKQVASECGFTDPDNLRRAFVRAVGVTPAEYRKRSASIGEF